MDESVADEVNRRLSKATQELQAKYQSNDNESNHDNSIDGPTGQAYKEKNIHEQKLRKLQKSQKYQDNIESNQSISKSHENDDDDDGDDEDNDLRSLRESRLKQIKAEHQLKLENLGKGHGSYREISQDEFLSEVTSSNKVICHFYHSDFPRCKIMDHHLSRLVSRHVETKFVKINAEQSPFFVEKLKIRTIPSVILFVDGLAIDKILGFDGLTEGLNDGHEDEWPTIRLARLLGSKNMIDNEKIVDDDDIEKTLKAKLEEMKSKVYNNLLTSLADEDDFSLED